jgi:hypothetical protein
VSNHDDEEGEVWKDFGDAVGGKIDGIAVAIVFAAFAIMVLVLIAVLK